jgi:diguanylate cyclase (GGDEF)-like protein
MRAPLHLLASCLFCILPLLGRGGELPRARVAFKHYGVEAGLENLAIWAMLQDRQGFLWFATEGGVSRYDGHRFQFFGSEQGLPSAEVFTLLEDSQGTLWFGTYRGLVRWENGRFVQADLPSVPVEAIHVGPGGQVWVTTPSGPFRRETDGRFHPVPGWPGGEATALWAAPDQSRVYLASSRNGQGHAQTEVFQWEGGRWTALRGAENFRAARLDSMVRDHRGRLWARSSTGLWVLPPDRDAFQLAQTPPIVAGSRGFLSLDGMGHLWVPTSQSLLHLEEDTWEVLGAREGIPTEFARAVMEDREGSLWIAGVGAFRRLGRGMLSNYTVSEGLSSNIVWALFRDRRQNLWVGTDRGACRATAQGWEVMPGTQGYVVRTLAEDRAGRLYVAGNTQEVLRYDPASGQLTRFPIDVGRPVKRIFRLCHDTSDRLWVGTESAGLLMADCRDPQLRFRAVALPDGDPSERVPEVTQDSAGRIWACGSKGLALLEGGTWRRFTTRDGLRQTHVSYLRQTPKGDFLLAYFEAVGISRFQYADGKLTVVRHLNTADGLATGKVYIMGEDGQGRLWIGTGRGLDILSKEGAEHIGFLDGLPSDDCNANAYLADPSGDVWLGTSGGLARFQTRRYPGAPAPPNAVLVSARAGQRQLLGSPATPARISHGDATVEFTFAGLSYISEGQVEHQVRLVGLENEWRTTSSREARYPALSKGHYRFEVRARIGSGKWSNTAAFPFEVLPPWWQTWWFYLAAAAAGAGAVVLVVRWRIAALRRNNRELETLVLARTQELKQANEALRSQSLTDPLTGLRNRRYLGESLPEDIAQVNRIHRSLNLGFEARLTANTDILFLMVDIDHFKAINDEFGHRAGDAVLRQVAELLRLATRESDTAVRWGGEEFLVVARHTCRADAPIMAERIRSMVAEHLFDLGEEVHTHRTCSVGYASYPLSAKVPELFNWEQVVDLADQCLFAAKRSGRNAWVGVVTTDEAKLLSFHRSGFVSVDALVDAGAIAVQASLPEGTALEWKPTLF